MKTFANLSERQKQMMFFIGNAWSNKRIAHTLGLSLYTVHVHVRELKAKLKLHKRLDVALLYRESLRA